MVVRSLFLVVAMATCTAPAIADDKQIGDVTVNVDEVVFSVRNNSVLKPMKCRGRLFGRRARGRVQSTEIDISVPPMELAQVSMVSHRGAFVDGWSRVKCSR